MLSGDLRAHGVREHFDLGIRVQAIDEIFDRRNVLAVERVQTDFDCRVHGCSRIRFHTEDTELTEVRETLILVYSCALVSVLCVRRLVSCHHSNRTLTPKVRGSPYCTYRLLSK